MAATGDTQSTFLVGELISDRFRVIKVLATGGMGEVYEVFDEALGKRVALKTLRRGAADPTARRRFTREIVLAQRVTHPNVCRTFDAGVVDDIPFLTMELHRGETLAQRLARLGRIGPADALPIIEQVAAGLSAAHRAGVVHRDLKSANVLLVATASGERRAVVSDFGIAVTGDASMRSTGALLGSPAYMAPEQVRGLAVTPATDIYALGVVMYEMATGQLPFAGATAMMTAMQRLERPPRPPRALVPELPRSWEAVILRCLERDPSRRFGDAGEVPRALADPSVGSNARGHRPRRWVLGAAAALVASTALGTDGDAGQLAMPSSEQAAQRYGEGIAYLRRFECVRGRDRMREVVEREPVFAGGHAGLAEAYSCLGHDEEAVRAATTALQRSGTLPGEERTRIEAMYWHAARRPDRAAPLYARLFADRPGSIDDGHALMLQQIYGHDPAGARATLAALQRRGVGDDAKTLFLEAQLLARDGADPAEVILKTGQATARASARGETALVASARFLEIDAFERMKQLPRALEVASEAAALMAQIGDVDGAAAVAVEESRLLGRLGRVVEAGARARDAEALALQTGSSLRLRSARLAVAQTAWARGDMDAARATFVLIAHHDEIARQMVDKAFALCLLARLRLAQGSPRDAQRLLDEITALRGAESFATSAPIMASLRAHLAFAVDDVATAQHGFEALLAQGGNSRQATDARLELSRVLLASGDFAAARAHARVALEDLERAGEPDDAALARVVIALAALGTGDHAAADAALAGARPRAKASERPRLRALTTLAEVRIAAASNDPARLASARGAAELALRDTERLGLVEAFEARLVLGTLDLATGSRRRLEALTRDAEARGLTHLARRAATLLASP
jgi:tRNA A-37 threonylcarbamoyl transferase component Bud32